MVEPQDDARSVRGAVVRAADVVPRTDLEGHPGIAAHRLLRPPSELSRWLHVTMNLIERGGGIHPHYHEGLQADHAYYVIEGRVRATMGDEEFDVGADSLIVFPCEVVHGFTVIGEEGARILRLGAAPSGHTSGASVFV